MYMLYVCCMYESSRTCTFKFIGDPVLYFDINEQHGKWVVLVVLVS